MSSHSLTFDELLILTPEGQSDSEFMVGGFILDGVSRLCPGCSRVSDPAVEDAEAHCQAGSSLVAVELPRKRKGGDVEERSDSHVE